MGQTNDDPHDLFEQMARPHGQSPPSSLVLFALVGNLACLGVGYEYLEYASISLCELY